MRRKTSTGITLVDVWTALLPILRGSRVGPLSHGSTRTFRSGRAATTGSAHQIQPRSSASSTAC